MFQRTVCYDLSPALQIVEARIIELPSGTSLAQFLMVSLAFEASSSHHRRRYMRCFGEYGLLELLVDQQSVMGGYFIYCQAVTSSK